MRPSYLILPAFRCAADGCVSLGVHSVTYPKRTLPLSFPSVPCDPGVSLPLAPSDVRQMAASAIDTWTTSMLSLGVHSVTYPKRTLPHSHPALPCPPCTSLATAADPRCIAASPRSLVRLRTQNVRSLSRSLRFLAIQASPSPSSIPCDAGVLLVGQDPGPALLATCAAFPARPVLLS